jgi:alanine racemase
MVPTTWVEVTSSALAGNLRAIRNLAGTAVCAVVKANGYGHGMAGAAKIFAEAGAEMVGVTRADEAVELQRVGLPIPIFVMTPVPDPRGAAAGGWRMTVASTDEVKGLPSEARVHFEGSWESETP